MSDETRRILELLAQGKITVDEADRLMRAVDASQDSARPDAGAAKTPRFIRIAVHKPSGKRSVPEDVNIRVPVAIIKGGMRLGAMLPRFVGESVTTRLRERGMDVDWSKLDPAAIDAMLREIGDHAIDVDAGEARVRISCE